MPESKRRKNRPQPARRSPNLPPEPPEPAEMSENEGKIEISRLTFRQQTALPTVALSPSIAQAARDTGIAESTLRRWLDDPDFREQLTRIRQASADLARQQLVGLMPLCYSVLADAMQNPDPAIRLRAVRYVMSFTHRTGEVETLKAQLQELEEAISATKDATPLPKLPPPEGEGRGGGESQTDQNQSMFRYFKRSKTMSLHHITHRIQALQRKYAPALAVIRLRPLAQDFCDRWEAALDRHEPLPQALPFMKLLNCRGFRLLPTMSLVQLIRRLRDETGCPRPSDIISVLLPGAVARGIVNAVLRWDPPATA